MPELPEVETTRRGLRKTVKGKRILKVTLRRKEIRVPIPKRFTRDVTGARIIDIRRRAKYLLFDLDNGEIILAHLGMSGSFTVMSRGYLPRTHDHVLFELEGGLVMVFNDPRRFGIIDLMKAVAEKSHPALKDLGPEPFSREFSPEYLKARLAKRKGPIKPALMDQKLVVGVGNIYASEGLFLSGIHPATPCMDAVKKSGALVEALCTTLEAAIQAGGSTLRNYVGANSEAGYFQHHFYVYDRAGEPCLTCHSPIQSAVMAGRATYWCGHCQPIFKKRRKPE